MRVMLFNGKTEESIFKDFSAPEAIAEIARYEKQREIQIGDIVTDGNRNYLIVKIGENSYMEIQGTDFEPVSIGKGHIAGYHNLHDRKDMQKVIESLQSLKHCEKMKEGTDG